MRYTHDIIVIGAGSGGLNIAGFMNKAGFKILLIDKSDKSIGGDCLNFGCVPSKAMIHAAKVVYSSKEAKNFGISTKGKVDLKKVVKYVKDKQNIIREHENASWFRKIGMDVALGNAKFTGRNSVSVNGQNYSAKRIVIATGSRPRRLKAPGVEKVKYYTNEEIFDLQKLPNKLLVIGGGPIGMELGQVFSRLGSKVSILERGPKFLPKETPEMAQILLKQLKKEGMEFYFNTSLKKFTSKNEALLDVNGKEKKVKFDAVLVSIGRQLNIEGLDIEKAGIKLDESGRRLKVDQYLRTTNKNVYVCGDIAGSYQFTHAAELHAGIIISNFFSPFKKKLSNDYLSWVTFTYPEIANLGLSEIQLQKRKIPYEKLVLDFKDDDRAIVDDFRDGKLILFISKGKILGGSMAAPNAGELFQELVLANSSGLDIKHIFSKIYAYPTASRVNKKIISNYFSKKLTPFSKKVLRMLY